MVRISKMSIPEAIESTKKTEAQKKVDELGDIDFPGLEVIVSDASRIIQDPGLAASSFWSEGINTANLYLDSGLAWLRLAARRKDKKYKHAEVQERVVRDAMEKGLLDSYLGGRTPFIMGPGDARSEKLFLWWYNRQLLETGLHVVDISPDILHKSIDTMAKQLEGMLKLSRRERRPLKMYVHPISYEEIGARFSAIQENVQGRLAIINLCSINDTVDRITEYDSKPRVLIGQIADQEDYVIRTEYIVEKLGDDEIADLLAQYDTVGWRRYVLPTVKKYIPDAKEKDINIRWDDGMSAVVFSIQVESEEYQRSSEGEDGDSAQSTKEKILYISERKTEEQLIESYRLSGLEIEAIIYDQADSNLAVVVSKPFAREPDAGIVRKVQMDLQMALHHGGEPEEWKPVTVNRAEQYKWHFTGAVRKVMRGYREDREDNPHLGPGWSETEIKLEVLAGVLAILQTGENPLGVIPRFEDLRYDPYGAVIKHFLPRDDWPDCYEKGQDLDTILRQRREDHERKLKVLYIDTDVEGVLDPLARHYDPMVEDLEFVTAVSGQAAQDRLAEGKYDIIFTNLRIKHKGVRFGGLKIIEEIRQNGENTDTPVIVVSGTEHLHAVREAYELGATSFTGKPISTGYLDEYIVRVVIDAWGRANGGSK